MRLEKTIKNKQGILLTVFFILFSLSYTTNVFQVSPSDLFHYFERQPEGLVVGRLVRSSQDGVFSYGGLTGVNYSSTTERTFEQHTKDLASQHSIYIENREIPDSYQAYKSQTGGQGIIFSIMQQVLPVDNVKKLMIFRALNAFLVALIFSLFGGWVFRNGGFIASFVTLFLLLISPWLNMYAHNLWWVLWNFYLPFLAMLLILEKKHNKPKEISNRKVLSILFGAVFLKCFFTGFEFITTTLISAICPIVYYCFLERKSITDFIIYSLKASIAMLLAVLLQMSMLITQIKFIEGSFIAGINHILGSFTKRTEFDKLATEVSQLNIINTYLKNDAFELGFLSNDIQFNFGILIFIIFLTGIIGYYCRKKVERKHLALLIATAFSVLAPLSWLIIFKQHAVNHPHMDYIVWYIPFLLLGFAAIGMCISAVIARCKSK